MINAAEYGMPQRRRRLYILAYHKSSKIYQMMNSSEKATWIESQGILAQSFPVKHFYKLFSGDFTLNGNLAEITEKFNSGKKDSPFHNSGLMINGRVQTVKTVPDYNGSYTILSDIIQNGEVTEDFFIPDSDTEKWEFLKGSKSFERISKTGHKYKYSEGSMTYPDDLQKPSRTIITGEGGKSPSRFKHVINSNRGLRRLTPIELERLNMFPDNHTKGVTDTKRAFLMGNALVVGIVEKLGENIVKEI